MIVGESLWTINMSVKNVRLYYVNPAGVIIRAYVLFVMKIGFMMCSVNIKHTTI